MGGSQPPDEGVMYWGYDEPRGRFKTYFFNDQGPYDSDLSSYEGEVVDNRLVFTGGARFSHALDPRRHVAINPDGSIDVEWFLRNAAGTGMPWRSHR
jgi:hypothetical protein